MKIVIKCHENRVKAVEIKELSYCLRFDGIEKYKEVDKIAITNDNLPNCPAHTKVLQPEEMYAIYEYMKKIVEGA